MRYHIELADAKAIPTAVIRGRVLPQELSKFVPAACGEVWSFIRSAGLRRPGRHIALYFDTQGTVEVGAEVSEPFVSNDRVHCSQLPVGRVATTTHFGLRQVSPSSNDYWGSSSDRREFEHGNIARVVYKSDGLRLPISTWHAFYYH